MGLTASQVTAAQRLRDSRPPVLPGTNVVVDDKLRAQWYDQVIRAMKANEIDAIADQSAFCDIAGVPD